jgi:hypothetical protein
VGPPPHPVLCGPGIKGGSRARCCSLSRVQTSNARRRTDERARPEQLTVGDESRLAVALAPRQQSQPHAVLLAEGSPPRTRVQRCLAGAVAIPRVVISKSGRSARGRGAAALGRASTPSGGCNVGPEAECPIGGDEPGVRTLPGAEPASPMKPPKLALTGWPRPFPGESRTPAQSSGRLRNTLDSPNIFGKRQNRCRV